MKGLKNMIEYISNLLGELSFSDAADFLSKGLTYIVSAWLIYLFFMEMFGFFRSLIHSIFSRS